MSLQDSFRTWRRSFKAMLPYVRRREHRLLQSKYSALIDSLGWTAPPATQARLHAIKPIAQPMSGDVCLFVSFAPSPRLKRHVRTHIEYLLGAGVKVVLILNTDLAHDAFDLDEELVCRLSGVLVRENTGFDFAAWAHAFSLCEGVDLWTRLFLVNDSIVGPLNAPDFNRVMARLRSSTADVVGLTECPSPVRHVQSFFLVFNATALRSTGVRRIFQCMVSLPTKEQVIDVYETRLTQALTQHGLRCEALFCASSGELQSADDTSYRWAQLIRAGFPYFKTRVLAKLGDNRQVKSLVPAAFLRPDD